MMYSIRKNTHYVIRFFIFFCLLTHAACAQKPDVLKLYKYKTITASLIPKQFKVVARAQALKSIDATSLISKSNSAAKNTEILQKLIDEKRSVTLPNFEIVISEKGLDIRDNTTLTFQPNSVLRMQNNSRESYELLRVHEVKNISIKNPTLIGERKGHKGLKGEAGHGISIRGAINVSVTNFRIKDFWGDGIFIGRWNNKPAVNLSIMNGVVDNNRRNGISIVSVEGLVMSDVVASNSNGTLPMFGIDIEPHFKNVDQIKNVKFLNITTYNNANGGMMIALHKLAGADHKDIKIEIQNYKDLYSYHGLYLGRITKEFKDLSGYLRLNGISLNYNQVPLKASNNENKNFEISVANFGILNPRNKNFTTNEGKRVMRARQNVQVN